MSLDRPLLQPVAAYASFGLVVGFPCVGETGGGARFGECFLCR